jgi:hypothetical protein
MKNSLPKFILLMMSFILISNITTAQESSLLFSRSGNMYFDGESSHLYEGSPYFSDDWLPGEILLQNGKTSEKMNLMLDLHDGKVIRQTNGNNGEYLDKSKIDKLLLNKNGHIHIFKKISPSKFKTGREKGMLFYEVLSPDNDAFIIEYSVKFINGEEVNKGRALASPDYSNRFEMYKNYYILMNDGFYILTKLTKSGIMNSFKSENFNIKEYLKSNKIDFKNYDDINKLISQYYLAEN